MLERKIIKIMMKFGYLCRVIRTLSRCQSGSFPVASTWTWKVPCVINMIYWNASHRSQSIKLPDTSLQIEAW